MSLPIPFDWLPWLSALLAVVVVLTVTPFVIRLAHRRNWLAYPKSDRWHQRPTALMGGIALYCGVSIGLLPLLAGGGFPWVIWALASVLFATGIIDDLRGLPPSVKLLVQVICAGILLAFGHSFAGELAFWISIPLTFLWVIGITNSLNLLDNMDGLAAGTAVIAAAAMALFAGLTGTPSGIAFGLALAGAALGFLRYNFSPARIFMGDSGSLFLGFALAALAIEIQESTPTPRLGLYAVSLAVLAVPIFDTTLVTFGRVLSGRPISTGGRDHTSHRLVLLGMSERGAVVTLYAISAFCGGLALVFAVWSPEVFAALLLFLVVGLAAFGIYLGGADVYGAGTGEAVRRPSRLERIILLTRSLLGPNWKIVGGLVGDLLLVMGAFILAHELRFEQGLTPARQDFVQGLLPLVVVVKLSIFHLFGLYKGIWKHAGTPELVRIVAATCASSAALFTLLWAIYGFRGVSKGVAVIDAMIVLIAISGVRLGFRGLRQFVYAQRTRGKRVLLYGAGDAGIMALRELRQNEAQGGYAVGFLDDDPMKIGLTVQGLKVLGDGTSLRQTCRRLDVEAVLITSQRMTQAREAETIRTCGELGVQCFRFEVGFESLLRMDEAHISGA